MHIRSQLFLRPNLRIMPYLARLCQIRIRLRGAGLRNQRPRVQATQKSNGRDDLQLRLYLQEKVIIRKPLVRQATSNLYFTQLSLARSQHSSTLLCLLTTLQFARGKYVSAVLQQERQERLQQRMQERMEQEMGG